MHAITQLQLDNMQWQVSTRGGLMGHRAGPANIAIAMSIEKKNFLISFWNSGLKPIWYAWKQSPHNPGGGAGTKGTMWQKMSTWWPQWAESWIANKLQTAQRRNTMICVARIWNSEREFLLEAREWAALVKKAWEDRLGASLWSWTTYRCVTKACACVRLPDMRCHIHFWQRRVWKEHSGSCSSVPTISHGTGGEEMDQIKSSLVKLEMKMISSDSLVLLIVCST